MKIKILILGVILTLTMQYRVSAQGIAYDEKTYVKPSDPLVLARLSEWQDLKFGLMMHWGPYSQWGVVESWSICPEDYPFTQRKGQYAGNFFEYKKAYENLQTTFNPTRFNPDKWADAAKSAGMKYVVFTTKHHDGFAMYDTKYSDYKITSPHTPFSSNPKSDVTKVVFEAFRKQNFMIGAYYSKPDWHSEDYWWSYFPPMDRKENYDKVKYPERWARFNSFVYNQVQELVSNYGQLSLLWFDGSWAKLKVDSIATMARSKQPGVIIVDRNGPAKNVNYLTPEQKIPEKFMNVPWETCLTMAGSWSYVPNDSYKTSRYLIQTLVDIVAKNGNLLLNVGPGPDGEWDPRAYQRLNEIGAWMKINGESIYGTKPLAPYRIDKWAFTKSKNAVYLSYLPADKESNLPPILSVPEEIMNGKKQIQLLGYTGRLKWVKKAHHIEIIIPENVQTKTLNQAVWVFKAD